MKLIAAAIAFLIAACAINLVVDPYGTTFWVHKECFNAYKPDVLSHWRNAKPLRLDLVRPDVLLVGSSRVLAAWDPDHPAFASFSSPYNYGLPGPKMCELSRYFKVAVDKTVPKRAVIGMDLFAANAAFHSDACPMVSDLEWGWTAWPRTMLSADTFDSSQKTIIDQGRINPEIWQPTPRGMARLSPDIFVKQGGMRAAFARFEVGALEQQYLVTCTFSLAPPPGQRTGPMDEVRAMIRIAQEKGIETQLATHPVHARLLQMLYAAGMWNDFEQWKRDIVAINDEEAKRAGHPPFPFWDFSGYNAVTTEPVPPAGDATTPMKYYWDPSHYRSILGDYMFDTMYGTSSPERRIPPGFGVRLTSENIDAHLAAMRTARDAYAASHPQEAAEVAAAVAQAASRPQCRGKAS